MFEGMFLSKEIKWITWYDKKPMKNGFSFHFGRESIFLGFSNGFFNWLGFNVVYTPESEGI